MAEGKSKATDTGRGRRHPWLVRSVFILAIGLWLTASPLLLGYNHAAPVFVEGVAWFNGAVFNAVTSGLLLVLAAVRGLRAPRLWQSRATLAVGLWLATSPWLLGFDLYWLATVNQLLSGAAVVALSAWTLWGGDRDRATVGHRWHEDERGRGDET